MKNPPILISVLGFFAALAGFASLFLGRSSSASTGSACSATSARSKCGLGAGSRSSRSSGWLAAVGLWSLRPWAWMFAMIVAGFALFEAFLWMFQYPGTGLALGMLILPLHHHPVPSTAAP